jgi:hypothetical protein
MWPAKNLEVANQPVQPFVAKPGGHRAASLLYHTAMLTPGTRRPSHPALSPTAMSPGLWSLPVFLGKFAEKQLQRFLGMCSKMNHLPGNIANT